MGDDQFTLNDAVGIQLALEADRVILAEKEFGSEMQALIRDVQDFAKGSGVLFRY